MRQKTSLDVAKATQENGNSTMKLPPGLLSTRAAGVTIAAAAVAAAAAAEAAAITTALGSVVTSSKAASRLRGATETTAAVLAEITVSSTTTAAAATTGAATTATAKGGLARNGLQESRNLLVGLLQEVHELADNTTVATVEESSGNTSVTSASGTTDTMDVVVNISRKVIVDNVSDVGDIETTGSNSGSDHDGATAVTEELESTLTLTLSAVTVDRGGREALVDQEIRERVSHALGLDEDESETASMSVENIEEDGALVNVLDVLNLLSDVLRGRTNTANGQEDVVLQEISGQHLNVPGERGGEHEGLTVSDTRHVLAFNDATNLGLETHVKHAIGLIKNKVLDVAERNAASLYEIHKTSRSGDEQVTAALNLAKLRANVGTTVDHARANPRSVGELASLVVNLRDQLTCGGEDQSGRISLTLAAKLTSGVGRNRRRTVDEGLGKDGEKETTSLAGAGLGTSHQITAAHNNGNGVLLDGGGDLVAGHLDVLAEVFVQRRSCELVNRFGNVTTRSLDRNVVVLLEVDSGVLLGRVIGGTKKFALDTGVSRSGNVLSIAPLSVAGASSGRITSAVATIMTTATRVATSATPTAATVVVVVVATASRVTWVGSLAANLLVFKFCLNLERANDVTYPDQELLFMPPLTAAGGPPLVGGGAAAAGGGAF